MTKQVVAALALALVVLAVGSTRGRAQGTPCKVPGAFPGTTEDRLCVYMPFVSRAPTSTPTPLPTSTPLPTPTYDPGPWTYHGCRHMLVNGSFEEGESGWDGWNEFRNFWTQPVVTGSAKHGSVVARFNPREGGDAGVGAHASLTQRLPQPFPPPGLREVRVGAWIRTNYRDTVFQRDFFMVDVAGAVCDKVWSHDTSHNWQPYGCTLGPDSPFKYSFISVTAADYGDDGFSPTDWRVDAVSLEICLD